MSPNATRAFASAMLLCLLAAITIAMQSWVGDQTIYAKALDGKREAFHFAIVKNQAPGGGSWSSVGGAVNSEAHRCRLSGGVHPNAQCPYDQADLQTLGYYVPLLRSGWPLFRGRKGAFEKPILRGRRSLPSCTLSPMANRHRPDSSVLSPLVFSATPSRREHAATHHAATGSHSINTRPADKRIYWKVYEKRLASIRFESHRRNFRAISHRQLDRDNCNYFRDMVRDN